jgi:molybdopterin-guanine dinucleotide biosynthesis protein A
MIKIDGMLMIGSAGTNVGKTELACALLRTFRPSHDVVAIKVTTIEEKDGQCPRGGQGCGVCSSLTGDFCITQETDKSSGKDTARLLTAGASRVFWLRSLKSSLQDASIALLHTVGSDAVLICESNSLRQVVEPGLFLMVHRVGQQQWKKSAREVKTYADRIVVSDGGTFDIDLDRIRLVNRKWTLREKATAIIMAGGDSRRMGIDKSMLPVNGRPLIERIYNQLHGSFEQILISANDTAKFAFLGLAVIPDRIAGQGPLMGIASALNVSNNDLNFVVACDIPHIDLRFVRRMLCEASESSADIVLPVGDGGKQEPLFAVYRRSALEVIDKVLSSGGRKISDVFPLCTVKYMELEESLINLNTAAEYTRFQEEAENANRCNSDTARCNGSRRSLGTA